MLLLSSPPPLSLNESDKYWIPFNSFFKTINYNVKDKNNTIYITPNKSSILFIPDLSRYFTNNFASRNKSDYIDIYYKNFTFSVNPQIEFFTGMVLAYRDVPLQKQDQYLVELKKIFLPYINEPIFNEISIIAKDSVQLDEYVNMAFEQFVFSKFIKNSARDSRLNELKIYGKTLSDLYKYMIELEKANPTITIDAASPLMYSKAIELMKQSN